jgi:hypothetical protein
MKHVFVDTNIFLGFFQLKEDDLVIFEEFKKRIDSKEINLIVNEHIVTEYARNRDDVLSEYLNNVKKLQNYEKPQIPAFCRNLKEAKDVQIKINEFIEIARKFHTALKEAINDDKLEVDKIINTLFQNAEKIDTKIVQRAQERCLIGNPPRKTRADSIGDAIHWEFLLSTNIKEIVIIASDNDWSSHLDQDTFSKFLEQEWKTKKGAGTSIKFYRTIAKFLRTEFNEQKITEEQIHNEERASVVSAPTFVTTSSQLNIGSPYISPYSAGSFFSLSPTTQTEVLKDRPCPMCGYFLVKIGREVKCVYGHYSQWSAE